jgi:predicted Zn-dependent protease
VLPDSDPRSKELKRLGEMLVKLIPENERKSRPFEYSFGVIDSKEVNAFALPGGPIFFFTGLLDRLETEDQVVAILGHEIIHTRNMHWASAYADNMSRTLLVVGVLSVLRANDTVFDVAGAANTVFGQLPYSRRMEFEADRLGLELTMQAGYNPRGMVDVFRLLDRVSGGGKPPEWASTHPDTRNRIRTIEDIIRVQRKEFPAQRPRAREVMRLVPKPVAPAAKQPAPTRGSSGNNP